jgi:hypothetical protein
MDTVAALCKSVAVPAKRGFHSHFVQQGRVQKVRHRTDFLKSLLG